MKLFILLLVSFFEANPSITDVRHITPGNNIFSQEQAKVTIDEGNPLIEQQDPIIVLSEKQWIVFSEKISCPQACINQYFTDTRSGSFDHHPGHRPVSQLSGFVQ